MSLVLVTGATGFIGRHLCCLLHERGYILRGTFRQKTPSDFPVPIQWVKIGDIGPDTEWEVVLNGVQFVIHLAALAHQMGSNGEGRHEEFHRVNSEGTRRLAEAVFDSSDVHRLVFVSSIGAVKSSSIEPIMETTPCTPDSDYGRSKRGAELTIIEKLCNSRADWCIIRPTLVYGPGNPGNMARLLKLIRRGIPLPLASIRNQRSFVFVSNLTDVLERCLVHPGASRRIFAVSDGESISTPELLRRLSKHTDKPLRLFPLPTRLLTGIGQLGDVVARLAGRSTGIDSYSVERLINSLPVDTSPILAAIEWQPPFTMSEGLAATLSPETRDCATPKIPTTN